MNLRHVELACCLLLATSQAEARISSWDEGQLQLLRQHSTPLRWDNVKGPPQWVSGSKPRHRLGQRLHFIPLQPGEEVTLRAEPNTWLRLAGEGKTLRPEDLGIGVSTDARMFVETTPIQTIDPYSLLVCMPENKPSLVRLIRPHHASGNLVIAAYFSRVEPFSTLAPYRERVRLPGKAVRLRRAGEAASQPAWALNPEQSIEFSLKGPARLQLVALMRWPLGEPRREQSLVLQVTLDGADAVPLLLCPELDARHRTRVNGLTEPVSASMNGFLDVPYGNHHLHIQASAPVYLSVFRQSRPDFLLPRFNGPATNIMQPSCSPLERVPELSVLGSKRLSPSLSAGDRVTMEQAAWRLARDNGPMDAGAQAADWLDRLVSTRQDYPAAQRTAETLWHRRTVYREVLPASLSRGEPLRPALFAPGSLQPLFKPERDVAVYNPTLGQVAGMFAEGHFTAVPPGLSRALLYELPARTYDSRLRIAATTSSATRNHLLVQFDQEAPFPVSLDAATVVPKSELGASASFATLRVLEQEAHLPNSVSGHPFGEFDLPYPLSEPGVIELLLPQRVRQVRIRMHEAAAPILTSVAYRAAKPFGLGETGYLVLLNRVGSPAAMRQLAYPHDTPETAPEPLRELGNHLLPLTRLVGAQFRDFTNRLDLASLPPQSQHPLGSEEASMLRDSAVNLEREGQLIEATATWNRLFWDGAAADRSEVALAITRCLESQGEDFLAAQYARYVLMTCPDPQIATAAVSLLEKAARRTADAEQLEELRSFVFQRYPSPKTLAGLTEALALNGHHELALSAGLILPREDRPAEQMLGAALRQNWWQTFDQLVDGLRENDAKHFWRAQKHLAFHQFVEAERELKQAGEKGCETLRALQEGTQIREQLAAPELAERLEALFAWEQWQWEQPGPKIWRTAKDIFQEGFATEQLFNSEQNRFTTYFRADRARPVQLRFLGPLRLQVEVRPILEMPFEEPVNDWLEVAEYGITNRTPVSQCIPNPTLQFSTRRNARAGMKTVATLEWGPGWHEVEVTLARHSGLIRVLQEQPLMPTRILPALNSHRINFVLRGDQAPLPTQNQDHAGRQHGLWWVPPDMAHPRPPLYPVNLQTVGLVADHGAATSAGLTDIERLRLSLRTELEAGRALEYDSQLLQELPPSEQWLATCRAQRWHEFTHWASLPDSAQMSGWLATDRIRELLDSAAPRDILQRLITLLEISELFPAWREEAQCLAEFLAAETNYPPGSRRILFRLTRDRIWTPLNISPLSAGVRPLQVPSDLTQDPSTRLRRALLQPAGTNQFTLSGQSVFTASMTLQRPARVQLHAEPVKAGFSPLAPLTVLLQPDDLEVQRLSLTPPGPEATTHFSLSEGTHLVRVWIENPAVNQWVRLTLSGSSDEGTNALWSQPLAEIAHERRFFHAATPAQPVRFPAKGPALLRVDEDRDGKFVSHLRLIQRGEQTVEIPSAPGRTASWYQVFSRDTQTNRPQTRVTSSMRDPKEVPPAELHLPESAAPSQAQLRDYYRLGGQESGTWTPAVLLVHRRPFEISTSQNTIENEFIEANVAYRKATPSETIWFKTEALGRLHQPGDLTVGLSERVEGHPQTLPFDWTWMGEAFVGTVGPQQEDVQWALHTKLELGQRFRLNRKLDWYPSAGLFARYLSLDSATAGQYDYIDQDLFTTFRSEQRWGGILGSRLEYRPWLDTLLRGSVHLMSNEDFTPDNWGVHLSWTQLMGPFQARTAYRFRHFLKDPDRSSASLLQGVSAGLYAEHWVSGRHRVEVGVQYSYNWPDSGDSYFLVLRWDFSQGRRYKDYAPHEMAFRDLRSRRFPGAFNNLLEPGLPGMNEP